MSELECTCRCDDCRDVECEGVVCKPHAVGRWVIDSPYMTHPMPTDFTTRENALGFIAATGVTRLTVREVVE